nr:MAG TPA: hypothetical protein [Caudoviricetes sp.]
MIEYRLYEYIRTENTYNYAKIQIFRSTPVKNLSLHHLPYPSILCLKPSNFPIKRNPPA